MQPARHLCIGVAYLAISSMPWIKIKIVLAIHGEIFVRDNLWFAVIEQNFALFIFIARVFRY